MIKFMTEEITLTPEGVQKLKQELVERKIKRKEIIEKIELAKEHGDLSENAEYHEARSEQSFNEGRIIEMENILKNANVVQQEVSRGTVKIGTKVATEFNGQSKSFIIVGSNEGNPSAGLISCDSPLGEALLGKKVGDIIEIKIPKGVTSYKIISAE